MTIAAAMRDAAIRLGDMREARLLMASVLRCDPGRLTMVAQDDLGSDAAAEYQTAIQRRLNGEPVSHIIGYRQFWGRRFRVTPDVLDPRPETETLIAAALGRPFARLLDLGTGSGCIAVTILAEVPKATGLAVDVSEAALRVAQENATELGVADRLDLQQSDWFSNVTGTFDLIVSNPPYIPQSDMAELMPEVREYEPHMALTDGHDGLDAYRHILGQAADYLAPNGVLLAEFGAGQEADIEQIAHQAGWESVSFLTDLDGRLRVLVAKTAQWRPFCA